MKTPLIATALAVALGLTGCYGGNTVTPFEGEVSRRSDTPTPTPTQVFIPVGKFGDTITWPSGVSVKVPTPEVLDASEFADGAIDGKIVKVDLIVTNGSDEPVEPPTFPGVTYGPLGVYATDAYDVEAGTTYFSTILPGETQTATSYYGIPTAEFGNIRVEVSPPDYYEDPAIFKGAIQ